MKPASRLIFRHFRLSSRHNMRPRYMLKNCVGNLRIYKTYKRAIQAMRAIIT